MREIIPCDNTGTFNSLEGTHNSIFLAGPCPRKNYREEDWRGEACDILESLGFDGTVINPTNENYQFIKGDALVKQTMWEHEGLSRASVIVFWIDRSEKHPAFTTNIEFGEWLGKKNVVVGMPDHAIKNDYLKIRLDLLGVEWYTTLEDTLKAAVDLTRRPGTVYFTSDTHFSQSRTWEFSRRPFVSVREMDLAMISNWNKNVTDNDVVYHAGDFGDPETMESILSSLNYKELHLIAGNYEMREIEKVRATCNLFANVHLYEKGIPVRAGGSLFYIRHEPVSVGNDSLNSLDRVDMCLYGHIHGRSFAKRNGIDLGTDYHGYTPISLETVKWFMQAAPHWDENVFTDRVII